MDDLVSTVFFDIGDTLGKVSTGGPGLELDPFPHVPEALAELKRLGVRMGIISDTGDIPGEEIDAMLERASLCRYLTPDLLLYSSVEGVTKKSVEIFRRAIARAGQAKSPNCCLFVGEEPGEREMARGAGMQTEFDVPGALALIRRQRR